LRNIDAIGLTFVWVIGYIGSNGGYPLGGNG
jgi:hypothetical protein